MSLRLIASILLAACCSVTRAAETTNVLGALYLTGKIEKGDALQLSQRLDGYVRYVVIRSPGGDVSEALAIAEVMRKSGKWLHVGQYCFSACALAFALTDKHYIPDGSFLAFHAGDRAFAAAVASAWGSYEFKSETVRQQYQARREGQLRKFQAQRDALANTLKELGRDAQWDETVLRLTGVKLHSAVFDEDAQTFNMQWEVPVCDWWVPDQLGLEEIGLRARKFTRPDQEKIAERLGLPVGRIYWGRLSEWKEDQTSPCTASAPKSEESAVNAARRLGGRVAESKARPAETGTEQR